MLTNEIIIIAVSAIVAAAVFLFVRPIPQDERYHLFADSRTFFGIANFMNVISNIFFVIAGMFGLYTMLKGWEAKDQLTNLSYLTFFAGVLLTGFGSTWYHLKPDNETLVWDRLPMTIAFAGLFCSILSEIISPAVGAVLLLPLLALGVFSVLYWISGERKGSGDLRLYGIIQFLPLLLIPLILFMYGGENDYIICLVGLMLFYGLAKIFEFLDRYIYSLGKVISGHTLKHISASVGVVFLAWMFV